MRFLPLYNTISLFLILTTGAACSSYKELKVDHKIILSSESSKYKITDAEGDTAPVTRSGRDKIHLISSIRYLAAGKGFSPEAIVMDRGVTEALDGNYIEAEILFRQIRDNIKDGSVENNLAVIYELTKRKKEAMKMYSNAIIKSPDNSRFISNFQSFINQNKFKTEK